MAFPFLLLGGLFGAGSGILGGISGNNAVERQAEAQKAAERIRASDKRDQNAKVASRNVGALAAGNGDRRAFGRSSRNIMIAQLTEGAKSEEAINADSSFRILSIAQQAANAKVDLIGSAVQGFRSGISFGRDLGDLIE